MPIISALGVANRQMEEELKVIITAETTKLKQNVDKAKESVNDFQKEVKTSAKEVSDKFISVGKSVNSAMKTVAVAVAGAVTALLALGASTAEYREEQAKLTTAFETAGASAETAKTTYNDLYRVLGDTGQAVEAANHLAKLTTNQQDLSEWTEICQGVYATFGDSLPIEGLTEAANETAKTGEVTGSLADALNWAGVSEDAFNEKLAACNDEAEREKLIRETLNGVYSDAAAAYEENNAQILAQNEAQSALNDSMAELGEAIAPINTALTQLAADVLAQLTPYIEDFVADYLPQITEALSGVGETIGNVLTFITDNWEIISTIATIVIGIAVALSVLSTVLAVVNAVLYANPVVWIVVAIIAIIAVLVTYIVLLIKYWDEIKAVAIAVWEAVCNAVQVAVNWIVEKFQQMKEWITNTVTTIKEAVTEKFNAIKQAIIDKIQAAKDKVVTTFENIKTSIQTKIQSIKTNVTSVFTSIKTTMQEKIESAKATVLGIFQGIKDGITEKINNAKTAVSGAIEAIKGFFNFSWSLPSIKLPHFSITGSFSLNPPSIPHFSVSWYKMGGVFDNATLFPYGNGAIGGLGEDGAEAVVPLEKNTKWLDRLATMLNEKQGNSAPIIMQVDGKNFAEIAVNSINKLTRQRGSLPLIIE